MTGNSIWIPILLLTVPAQEQGLQGGRHLEEGAVLRYEVKVQLYRSGEEGWKSEDTAVGVFAHTVGADHLDVTCESFHLRLAGRCDFFYDGTGPKVAFKMAYGDGKAGAVTTSSRPTDMIGYAAGRFGGERGFMSLLTALIRAPFPDLPGTQTWNSTLSFPVPELGGARMDLENRRDGKRIHQEISLTVLRSAGGRPVKGEGEVVLRAKDGATVSWAAHAKGTHGGVRIEARLLDGAPRPAAAAPDKVVAWLKSRARPIAQADPGSGLDDLGALEEIVGDARVVSLGEASHGTREFFQLKHRSLEFLVEKMGFTAFAFEDQLARGLRVNEFVLGGPGDAESAVRSLMFAVWKTREVAELVLWMRAYNDDPAHRRKVRFYGIDMQESGPSARSVLEYFRKVDADYAPDAEAAMRSFGRARQGGRSWNERVEAIAGILERFDSRRKAYVAASDREEFLTARQCARVLFQMLQMEQIGAGGRDQAMAENVEWVLDMEGDEGKVVVWAHNAHVQMETGFLGGHLRRSLGRRHVALGFSFNEGEFRAAGVQTARPAAESGFDAALARVGMPLFLVDLRGGADSPSPEVKAWFRSTLTHRTFPGNHRGGIDPVSLMVPSRTYDGVIFVEKTSATRPLPRRRR